MSLAGGGRPNDRTVARFRRKNAAAFAAVFQETVILAFRLGLARRGHMALDGTTLKATTSKHTALSSGRMRPREPQLTEEIARLVAQAEAQDTAEEPAYGVASDGSAVAEERARREARRATIQAARAPLEAEQRAETEPRACADPDARIMLLTRGEYASADHAQAAVDAARGSIAAAALTPGAPDVGHLPALAGEGRALRDGAELPGDDLTPMSADAGDFSGANAAHAGTGLALLLAAGRADPAVAATTARGSSGDRFGYDPTRDGWICPPDNRLRLTPPTGPSQQQPGSRGVGRLHGLPTPRHLPEAQSGARLHHPQPARPRFLWTRDPVS